jgi:hypothetical protein
MLYQGAPVSHSDSQGVLGALLQTIKQKGGSMYWKIALIILLFLMFVAVARADDTEPNCIQQVVIEANDFVYAVYSRQKKFFDDGPWNDTMPDNITFYVKPEWSWDGIVEGGEVGIKITF